MDVYLTNTLFLLLIVTYQCKGDTYNLTWVVKKKVSQYGDDLSLSCYVENCCQKSAGWGKWTTTNEFTTIFIDVQDLKVDDSSKYDGGTNKNGFFLVIRNITIYDLNMTYICTYGFLVGPKRLLLETDALDTNIQNGSTVRGINDKQGNIELIISLSSVFVAACVVVAVIAVYFKMKTKTDIDKKNIINKTPTIRLDDQVPFVSSPTGVSAIDMSNRGHPEDNSCKHTKPSRRSEHYLHPNDSSTKLLDSESSIKSECDSFKSCRSEPQTPTIMEYTEKPNMIFHDATLGTVKNDKLNENQ